LTAPVSVEYINSPKHALTTIAHDWEVLKGLCLKTEEEFFPYGVNLLDASYPLIYKDNGSSVLAVAHLDTCEPGSFCIIADTPAGTWVFSPALDDRLGVYVITHVLPAMGINVDVLLTTGEEMGQSSGAFFDLQKKYNWMFQFDRRGTDVVTYDYGDSALNKRLNAAGFTDINRGLYSDICSMEHLGCKGINVGTAYYDYHSPEAFAKISLLDAQIRKFAQFYRLFNDSLLEHTPRYPYYRYAEPFQQTNGLPPKWELIECWKCYTIYETEEPVSRCPYCNEINPQ
jgi:hypothetical protein